MKIYEWECPKCQKKIVSIYELQFRYNKEEHQKKHNSRRKKQRKGM